MANIDELNKPAPEWVWTTAKWLNLKQESWRIVVDAQWTNLTYKKEQCKLEREKANV